MKSTALFLLLLAAVPSALHAQATPDSLRRGGELTGARPSGSLLARPRTPAAARRPASPAADSFQRHLLGTEVTLPQAGSGQLPDLYESFIAVTRAERRQWAAPDWQAAGQVLTRLNQRYEEVRTELPLEERLRIRSFQGEFRTLRGARQVQDRLN